MLKQILNPIFLLTFSSVTSLTFSANAMDWRVYCRSGNVAAADVQKCNNILTIQAEADALSGYVSDINSSRPIAEYDSASQFESQQQAYENEAEYYYNLYEAYEDYFYYE